MFIYLRMMHASLTTFLLFLTAKARGEVEDGEHFENGEEDDEDEHGSDDNDDDDEELRGIRDEDEEDGTEQFFEKLHGGCCCFTHESRSSHFALLCRPSSLFLVRRYFSSFSLSLELVLVDTANLSITHFCFWFVSSPVTKTPPNAKYCNGR